MSDSPDVELPRGVALAWGIASSPQRGPKREMSVEKIVDAAVAIADAEGLGAVSMAAVAARLGFTPMSLYRYVTAKDDLLLLMQEQATGLPPEEVREVDGWREKLQVLYGAQMHRYLEHPWLLEVPITGAPATPNSAAWIDAGLVALDGTPLTHDERMAVSLLVAGHARWAGMVTVGYARTQGAAGVDESQFAAREDALFRDLITADAYPALRAAIDAGVFLGDSDPFAFGLARSLDGVAAYLAGAEEGRRDAPIAWPRDDNADIAGDKRFRDARKAVHAAEKALRDARRLERVAAREAKSRLG
ncbi:TetR/AcrR family transcriptional regulator C-terminal domain-containing protein [Microbacterium sp. Sa4CUA7]|uniref:TetR/AcrR family transcriptional regulator C-terminal domain-containing protein n=1 Tax=Microbacterium pullorum TaxID=2762236 RepID=A0ABR8RXX2_9MICO|nr:TetR/AcrR family transcriptional regulator C-terminal domain-containing protein [Microbacterium pullorum]MBD7956083.1 TetR/AcrR family transcriptional regulator C-terminal domain-containing protein [Microbacterium pullorum]